MGQDGKLVTYAVSQHIENAGVHSGDATLVLPPIVSTVDEINKAGGLPKIGVKPLTPAVIADCKVIAEKVAAAFKITGPFNMQIIKRDLGSHEHGHHAGYPYELKVIECNLRASRSFPFVSKTLATNFIDLATRAIVSHPSLGSVTPEKDLMLESYPYKCVKVPIFSWTRLGGADPMLGVEMASTGEVACFGRDVHESFLVGLLSNHQNVKQLPMPKGTAVSVGRDHLTNMDEFAYICESLLKQGYKVLTDNSETTKFLEVRGIKGSTPIVPDGQLETVMTDKKAARKLFQQDNKIMLTINLARERPELTSDPNYLLRRTSVDLGVGIINDSKVACVLVDALEKYNSGEYKKSESAKSWVSGD